ERSRCRCCDRLSGDEKLRKIGETVPLAAARYRQRRLRHRRGAARRRRSERRDHLRTGRAARNRRCLNATAAASNGKRGENGQSEKRTHGHAAMLLAAKSQKRLTR